MARIHASVMKCVLCVIVSVGCGSSSEKTTILEHCFTALHITLLAEAMVTPRRKCRRPAMVTPKSYPYP